LEILCAVAFFSYRNTTTPQHHDTAPSTHTHTHTNKNAFTRVANTFDFLVFEARFQHLNFDCLRLMMMILGSFILAKITTWMVKFKKNGGLYVAHTHTKKRAVSDFFFGECVFFSICTIEKESLEISL
jgi:hypothetical protein